MTIFGRKNEIPDIGEIEIPDIPDIEGLGDVELLEQITSELEKELLDNEQEILLNEIESKRHSRLRLGKVIVEENESVTGAIFAVGEVIVRGNVVGDVISYKRITVTSTGKINGNATAPEIVKMRGGRISGKRLEDFPVFDIPDLESIVIDNDGLPTTVNLSILGGLLVFGIIVLIVAPNPLNRIRTCFDKSFLKAFTLGFLFWFAFAPLFGLLCLTIVGIPVAVIALPIATLFGILLGIIGFSYYGGTVFTRLFKMKTQSRLVQFTVGIILLYLSWLIWGALYAEPDSTSQGFAVLFLVISIVIWSIGVSAGVGSIIITRFGFRDCKDALSSKFSNDTTPPPPSPPPLRKDQL